MIDLRDSSTHSKYWEGGKNKAVRYYFYIQQGLKLVNEFRYLIMSIFVIYAFLKVDNILLIPAMFMLAIPILCYLGWVSVHHVQKVMEYLNIQFSTHWSKYNIELQEEQKDLLKEIKDLLNKN